MHDLAYVHYLYDTQANIATTNTEDIHHDRAAYFHSSMPPKASSLPAG